jgi:hypothetical protein
MAEHQLVGVDGRQAGPFQRGPRGVDPRSTAGTSEKAPRNFPTEVRAPSMMTARSMVRL